MTKSDVKQERLSRRDFLKAGALTGAGLALTQCAPGEKRANGGKSIPKLITTFGPKSADELGMILPHEHIFVDLRTPDHPEQGQADPQDVIRLMAPEIEKARAAGVTAIVECSPVGVGRRADILKAVSEATNYPLVVPTGIYREPWVPAWTHEATETKLYKWMIGELRDEIEDSGVQAAWIKLSAGDNGITECEIKILRAAAKAAAAVGAIIGSHTRRGRVVHDQLDIIEDIGYTPERFIWIHAQNDTFEQNLEIAKRGAWIEYDAIGGRNRRDDFWIERIQDMLAARRGDQILLSHDRGWYDPAKQGGGVPRPFTYISELFLPKLQAAGVDETTIRKLTVDNPFRAFSRNRPSTA
jgi:phosphotriesterase-related protein